jgi:hypothetical protein
MKSIALALLALHPTRPGLNAGWSVVDIFDPDPASIAA